MKSKAVSYRLVDRSREQATATALKSSVTDRDKAGGSESHFLSKEGNDEVDMRVVQIIAIVIIVALWIGDIWLIRECDRMEKERKSKRRKENL